MKTTIELPDALFIAVKAAAVKRRTTMKAMLEHALRREIAFEEPAADKDSFETNSHGFPILKRRSQAKVTSAHVYDLLDEEAS